MISFLKNNWLNILGLVGSIIGLYLSVYFYDLSKIERQPIFVVDPVRTQILSEKTLNTAPIKVFTSDGKEIQSELTSVRFYFWNEGKLSIRQNNVLEPLKIALEEKNAKIIDFRILKEARHISKVKLRWDSLNSEKIIALNFDILEKNDGITGQIIYEGDPRSKIKISGFIEGIPSISESENDVLEPSIFDYLKSLMIVWFFISIIVIAVIMNTITKKYGAMETWPIFTKTKIGTFIFQKVFKYTINIVGSLMIALFTFLIIYVFIIIPLQEQKETNRRTIIEKVPKFILP